MSDLECKRFKAAQVREHWRQLGRNTKGGLAAWQKRINRAIAKLLPGGAVVNGCNLEHRPGIPI